MADEIERKFLVSDLPTPLPPGVPFRQGYVALDGEVEVRIRIKAGAATLTVKAGSGLRRSEVEVPVGVEDAEELWGHAGGRRIEKDRHAVPLDGGAVAELDVYHGALEGLHTVEVEFADEQAAGAFAPPAWFGEELTGRKGWSNAALAVHGRPA